MIDAAHRFDEERGIKFETFAERRVRGAMIDALRRDAWPRGVRRQRRELDAAREALRRELGHEPSMADLAARVGSDEKRLSRTIVRINTIESTSPLATGEHIDESSLPTALVPSEPDAPDAAYEKARDARARARRHRSRCRGASSKVIGLYYYGEVTMKQIGAEIGVNESRVSQLHARAIRRLREALGEMGPQQVAEMRKALVAFAREAGDGEGGAAGQREDARRRTAVVLPYKPAAAQAAARDQGRAPRQAVARAKVVAAARDAEATVGSCRRASKRVYASPSRTALSRSPSLNGFASQRQPLSSRNCFGVGAGDVAGHEDHALARGRARLPTSVR